MVTPREEIKRLNENSRRTNPKNTNLLEDLKQSFKTDIPVAAKICTIWNIISDLLRWPIGPAMLCVISAFGETSVPVSMCVHSKLVYGVLQGSTAVLTRHTANTNSILQQCGRQPRDHSHVHAVWLGMLNAKANRRTIKHTPGRLFGAIFDIFFKLKVYLFCNCCRGYKGWVISVIILNSHMTSLILVAMITVR